MIDSQDTSQSVCVVGAGLAGTLMALLMAQIDGVKVMLFEKRPDLHNDNDDITKTYSEFGASTSAVKRSINLALSYRGQMSLHALNDKTVYEQCMEDAIRMPCRVIHNRNGTTTKQPYGNDSDAIWSVSRQKLNGVLLEKAKKCPNITIKFGYALTYCDKDGNVQFTNDKGEVSKYEGASAFDLVIGADGAYSATREHMLKQSRINFNRQYIQHGYKELSIPFKIQAPHNDFALHDHQGLHIWPRGDFMLIALPNSDKSFTATLFAPYKGKDGFDDVDITNDDEIKSYFERHFPDVMPYMPQLVEDYQQNPVGSLVTVRVNPWNLGKVVLIGETAVQLICTCMFSII
jgi:kynurenine 3-monooxygenase